ncbi:MAG: hypothetical protein E7361_00305 [Clostridiales bacterium]|nr:hypothetical protein [Clostridiales bacterium]
MKKGLLVLMSGSSGVGKNTVIDKLIENNDYIGNLRSCTSRAIRVDDKVQEDGNYAYYFMTKEEFEGKIERNEMLEYDIFSGNYYGISKDAIQEAMNAEKTVIKDITVKGVASCKHLLGKNANIVSVFLTMPKSELKRRLVLRGTKDIRNRMKHYDFEQKSISLYDYCIVNKDLDKTLEKMEGVLAVSKREEDILCGEDISHIHRSKVDKIATKLKQNKKVKPVLVQMLDGKIYIVKGVNTYLASLVSGISVTKYFVENKKVCVADNAYWKEIISSCE